MTLPGLADRLRGAIWGQFVGDAYCLGSHWIYDLAALALRFPQGLHGFERPADDHYHAGKRPGDQTHYGDAALLLLQSIAELGRFDAVDFGRRFVALMESDTYFGYRDHATRETLSKRHEFLAAHPGAIFDFQRGADDDQPATVTRLAPLVTLHFRDPRLSSVIETATRICQDNARAIAFNQCHASILRALLNGRSLPEAVADSVEGSSVGERIRHALDAASESVLNATLAFGQGCPLNSSFPAALQTALAHQDDFAAAMHAAASAGGDSAARAAMAGAWLGASHGIDGIPSDWRNRLTAGSLIGKATESLVARILSHGGSAE